MVFIAFTSSLHGRKSLSRQPAPLQGGSGTEPEQGTGTVGTVFQDHGKGGLSLRGGAFMTVLAVLTAVAVLESTLPSFCLSYKIQRNEATVAGFDGFGGRGGFSHGGHPP